MIIKYAILGLLSQQPASGYDLKKCFGSSSLLYWSGNNNQIYTTLLDLHRQGLVEQQVQYQESLPAKKIYSITTAGKSELKTWVLSTPDLPEFKNRFLLQLSWAQELGTEQILTLLAQYEDILQVQFLMEQENARRTSKTSQADGRAAYLNGVVAQNILAAYSHELEWVRRVREGLSGFIPGEETP